MRHFSLQNILVVFSTAILINFILKAEADVSSAIMLASTLSLIGLLTYLKERDQAWRQSIINDVETKLNEQRIVINEHAKTIDQMRAMINNMSAKLEMRSGVGQKEILEQAIIRRF